MKPRIRYIVHWFFSPRDSSGNVYSYFVIADVRSGRILRGKDVPESNLRAAMFAINGGQHRQNYWFAQTEVKQRELFYRMKDIPYIGSSEAIAEAFHKMMRSRKPFERLYNG
jgi:hypothetical protein